MCVDFSRTRSVIAWSEPGPCRHHVAHLWLLSAAAHAPSGPRSCARLGGSGCSLPIAGTSLRASHRSRRADAHESAPARSTRFPLSARRIFGMPCTWSREGGVRRALLIVLFPLALIVQTACLYFCESPAPLCKFFHRMLG